MTPATTSEALPCTKYKKSKSSDLMPGGKMLTQLCAKASSGLEEMNTTHALCVVVE